MFFFTFLIACAPKKQSKAGVLEDKIQDVVMPVIDLETEPLPLEETIIVAGETQNKEWEAIPEPIKNGLQDLEKEFNVLHEITYKQDDDLTEEVTLAANIGYEKKISDQHFLKFNLDSTTSTQELTSFSGNFSYKFTF